MTREAKPKPPARPFVRAILGGIATVIAVWLRPRYGLAVGGVAVLWVLAGFRELVHRAASTPAHEVAAASKPAPADAATGETSADATREPDPTADEALLECPRCSMLLSPQASGCSCGWKPQTGVVATTSRVPS